MNNFKGLASAVVSAVTFGLIPLFTLPLMAAGLNYDSILVYRFFAAAIIIAVILLATKSSFRITRGEAPVLIGLSLFYVGSAYFLFWGYKFLSSGVATSIQFLYPVFVTIIMVLFFKEQKSLTVFLSVFLATVGIAVLSIGEQQHGANIFGVMITLLSGLSYALYIVGINKSKVCKMPSLKLTFYMLLFGGIFLYILAMLKGGVQPLATGKEFYNIIMLAIVPTVISNLTLVYALKNIGSVITSVMGAMEPVAAVTVGVVLFGEPFTPNLLSGIFLVIVAVTLVVLSRPMDRHLKRIINTAFSHLGINID